MADRSGSVAYALRRFWWRRVRRHRGEICQACGLPVALGCPTWWSTFDPLWIEVEGGHGQGIRCIPCFTRDALAAGVQVSWRTVVEARRTTDGTWVETSHLFPLEASDGR